MPIDCASFYHQKNFFLRFITALTLLFSSSVLGQPDIRFERITVEDGLSQSGITSMVQDKYGYLWIGTLDGLNRYDGSKFTTYRDTGPKKNAFPAHSVSQLLLDDREQLWIAYRNGLSYYEPDFDDFKNYRIQLDARNWFIRDLDIVSDSLMHLSTNLGILDFNPLTGDASISKTLSKFKNKNVFELALANDRTEWVFTDKSLWRKKYDSSQWLEFFRDENGLRATYFQKTDELYVRTENRLLKYNSSKDELQVVAHLSHSEWPSFADMYKTREGNLWVAHGSLSVFDRNDKLTHNLHHVAQDPNSLSGPFVSDIYQTRDGVVWVGTNGLGLNKYNPARSVFAYLGNFPGAPLSISNNYITSIYTDDDLTLLVNTLDGMTVIDLKTKSSKRLPVTGRNGKEGQVMKVFTDSRGKKWLGTNKGLMSFDGTSIHHSGVRHLDDADLTIYDATEVGQQNIVLATNKGLLMWDQQQRNVTTLPKLGSFVLTRINNYHWIQTIDSIKVIRLLDMEIIKTFPKNGSDTLHAPLAAVKCLFQDSNKNIWVGTDGGGLSLYDSINQTFTHFTEVDGLSNNVVYGILEDNSGNLWLSTNQGLSVFSKHQKKVIRIFYKTDGLQGNEFNTRAFFKSASGKMYFGGVNGLSFFDPAEALKIPSFTPKSVLTGFYINNVKQDNLSNSQISQLFREHKIRLDWNQRNFSFDVAGLGFTFPSGIQYQYKLEGFDMTWNTIGNQTRITFTNMSEGNYTLRVKSGNTFGDWEQEGLAVQIEVVLPFWRSGWAIVGLTSLLVFLGLLISFQRTRFLKRRAIMLQSLVEQRTHEIQRQQEEIATQNEELTLQAETLANTNIELEKRVERRTSTLRQLNNELADQNVQLEQFTFITAHNIRGPVARIKGLINLLKSGTTEEVINHLETSARTLDEVINELNAVLKVTHGIDKKNELVSVKNQLMLVLEMLKEDINSVEAQINLSDFENVKIQGLPAYFQSIFYNLLHNALKYTDPQRKAIISCRTVTGKETVTLEFQDNGIGIDMRYAREKIFKLHQRFHPNIMGRGFGLFLVKTQVKAMGGTITVDSEVNSGTKFSIEFPLNGTQNQSQHLSQP